MTDRYIESIQAVIAASLARINTSGPGRILSWDASKGRATVQPTIQRRRVGPDDTLIVYTPKPIPNVPVVQLGGITGTLTFDLSRNDTGLILWGARSMSEWLTTGRSLVEPADPRRFDYSDAIFLPGLWPYGDAPTERADGAVVLSGDDVRLGSATNAKALAIAEDVEARLNALEATFNTHTHIYVLPSIPAAPGPTATPLPTATTTTAGATAATKVKGV